MDNEQLRQASLEAYKFIASMKSDELGIYTIRKAFEVGYLTGMSAAKDKQGEYTNDI